MAEIKLDTLGFAYVNVYIKPMSTPTMRYLSYKVDTGASHTTISRDWLHGLGYDDNWIKTGIPLEGDERPTVATGEPVDGCYRVALPEIHVGGYVGYNWPFLVSLNGEVQFRLLLGTDSMKFFKWEFDYERDICLFELIHGKRRLLFNHKDQAIHSIDEIDDFR